MEFRHCFDLIVIGTGTAGSTVAQTVRRCGWKVAIIDNLPFGGTCALRGCEPKKVLVEAAKVVDTNAKHNNKGVFVPENLKIRWKELINFKETFTKPFVVQREREYAKIGIETFHGYAIFEGPNEIRILGNLTNIKNSEGETKDTSLLGKKILIATGARPVDLKVQGSENILTSDQFLSYNHERLPNRIIFVGGGFISFEFACVAAMAGVREITILQRSARPLNNFDPDLVNLLLKKCKDSGINVISNTIIESVKKSFSDGEKDSFSVRLVNQVSNNNNHEHNSVDKVIFADMIVHGAGRIANVENLNLEKGSVKYCSQGIVVNDFLQSVTNPDVYAAGDVVANHGPNVTPKASFDGEIVATNIIKGNTSKVFYNEIPRVLFTIPALASVGKSESELRKQNYNFRINYQDTSKWYTSRRTGETCSGFKLLIENNTEKILGAHLIGPHAEEVINIFSIAIKAGLTTLELRNSTLYTYPTSSSDIPYMLE